MISQKEREIQLLLKQMVIQLIILQMLLMIILWKYLMYYEELSGKYLHLSI